MKRILLIAIMISLGYLGFSQSVTTNAATSVSYTSATLNASASGLNSGTTYYIQFYYDVTTGGLSNSVTTATFTGVTSKSVSASITGLSSNQLYYFRAYLFSGTPPFGSYLTQGSQLNFTTLSYSAPTVSTGTAASVTQTSFDVNVNNVSSNGGDPISEQGLVYSTTNNPPTTADTKVPYSPVGVGNYNVSLTSLTAGTTYYVRAYATNGYGTGYGSTITQATSSVVAPTVTIGTSITSISTSTADCNSNSISNDGGGTITEKGIVYNTSGTPTTSDSKVNSGSGIGSYNSSMSALSAGTKYYVRAYAINSAGTGYSSTTRDFITDTDVPTVASESNVAETSFSANWNTTTGAQGYKLDVSTASDFSSFVSGYNGLDVGNVTTKSVTGLTAGTVYYYRVRAYHDGGTDGASFESTSSANNAVQTLVTAPTTQASKLKWETIGSDLSLNWVNGNGAGRMVIMKAGGAVTDPSGGTTYNANATFGLGDQIAGSGTYVVYNATGAKATSVTVTNVTSGTQYYFKVIEYNGSGSTINYNTTATSGFNTGNSDQSALPIVLSKFNASANTQGILLHWETLSEDQNDFFEVQRSLDGKNFEVLGTLNGAGTSNALLQYNYLDQSAPNSVVYYRLKQVDFDGHFSFSKMIAVENNTHIEIDKIATTNQGFEVYMNSTAGANRVLSLYNTAGQLVEAVYITKVGAQKVSLDLSKKAHGVYYLQIDNGNQKVTRKLFF